MPFIVLSTTAFVGAFVSKQINLGKINMLWALLVSLVVGLQWAWLVKNSTAPIVSAVAFDVVYSTSFVLGFVVLGERMSALQAVGFALTVAGMAMMSGFQR